MYSVVSLENVAGLRVAGVRSPAKRRAMRKKKTIPSAKRTQKTPVPAFQLPLPSILRTAGPRKCAL